MERGHAIAVGLVTAALLAACNSGAASTDPALNPANAEGAPAKGSFLYVALDGGETSTVNVFTYPHLKLVANVPSDEAFARVCSDPKTGHVFVSQTAGLDEYERGGATPIKTLTAPDGYTALQGCSIDPLSGDLAVVAYEGSKGGGLLVYRHARGTPRAYSDPSILAYYYCSYDDRGNVFVLGYGAGYQSVYPVLSELPAGSGSFTDITLSGYLEYPKKIQWDGKHLALTLGGAIYEVDVTGSYGKIVGSTRMFGSNAPFAGISWITGRTVIGPYGGDFARRLGVWPYPAGGTASRIIRHVTTKNMVLSDVNLDEPPQP